MTGNKKGSFSFFPLSYILICMIFKIVVRFDIARLQVWGSLFFSHEECFPIEYEELSIVCMIKIN